MSVVSRVWCDPMAFLLPNAGISPAFDLLPGSPYGLRGVQVFARTFVPRCLAGLMVPIFRVAIRTKQAEELAVILRSKGGGANESTSRYPDIGSRKHWRRIDNNILNLAPWFRKLSGFEITPDLSGAHSQYLSSLCVRSARVVRGALRHGMCGSTMICKQTSGDKILLRQGTPSRQIQ